MEETLESEDNNGISVFDKVLNYQPLLTKVLTFVHGPPAPWPKPLLPLRLLSSHFNEAILNLQSGLRDPIVIKFRLPMFIDDWDGRLCRDVVVGCRCEADKFSTRGNCACALPKPALFTPFAMTHGFNVLQLHVADTSAKNVGTFLIVINKHCPNLRKLILDIEDLHRGIGEARRKAGVRISEFEGVFHKFQNNLRTLQLYVPEYRGSATRRHVAKVMSTFLSVTVDLETLIIEGDLSFNLNTSKLPILTSLKQTNSKIETVESQNGIADMVAAVAATLEKLEIHRQSGAIVEMEQRDLDYFGLQQPGMGDLHPLHDLPCLKTLSFSLAPDNNFYLGLALWDLILQGRAKCLETVKVDCIAGTAIVSSGFWTSLFNHVGEPVTTVRTLSIQGLPTHVSSDTKKLRALHQVFPNLDRIAYPVCAPSSQENGRDVFVQQIVDVLQSLTRWDKPFKEIHLSLQFECSINDVAAAFEIIEGFFALGFETLRIGASGWPTAEVWTENQFERLTRTLGSSINLLNLTFHGFTIPNEVADRLGDFIVNNRLPVTFSEQGFPEFE